MGSQSWRVGFLCTKAQVNINILLNCGQSFRWKQTRESEWIGVIGNHVWHLCQTESGVEYKVYGQQLLSSIDGQKPLHHHLHKKVKCEIASGIKEIEKFDLESKEEKSEVTASSNSSDEVDRNQSNGVLNRSRKRLRNCVQKKDQTFNEGKNLSTISTGLNNSKDIVKVNENLDFQQPILVKNIKPEFLSEEKKEDIGKQHLTDEDCEGILRDYFQLDVDLCPLYEYWSSRDPHFQEVAAQFKGIRMLRQDPTENLISFVCSSNNHISRITSMVEKLCIHYGKFIAEVDGDKYYSFPPIEALTANQVESHLRELGFGYRAKFIAAIAKYITQEKEDGWLDSLRARPYKEAKAELMNLMGVGAKVADCVCLMSLDKAEAVPVDTHVWQITVKNYMAKLQNAKSLTDKIYNEIGDFYRELWGPYAGWAHSVLFTADLKHNKSKSSDPSPVIQGKLLGTEDSSMVTETKKQKKSSMKIDRDEDLPKKAKGRKSKNEK